MISDMRWNLSRNKRGARAETGLRRITVSSFGKIGFYVHMGHRYRVAVE